MKPFSTLTTRGKARRLRAMALEALREYEIDVRRVGLVSNSLNGIFRIWTVDGCSLMLRVSLPNIHTLVEVQAEMAWLEALARDTDIPSPRPVRNYEGKFVTTVEVEGVPEPRHCAVFSWLHGRNIHEVATGENMARMGEMAARLHEHAASFRPPEGFWVRSFGDFYPFEDREVLFDPDMRHIYSGDTFELLGEMKAAILEEIERLYARSEPPRVIHGDLHWANVKVYRGRVQPLDFEDLAWGYPVQDIAISFYYMLRDERFPELRAAFRRGYERHSPWPEDYPGQIDLFIVHRSIDLMNFILSWPEEQSARWVRHFIEDLEIHCRARFEAWKRGRDAR